MWSFVIPVATRTIVVLSKYFNGLIYLICKCLCLLSLYKTIVIVNCIRVVYNGCSLTFFKWIIMICWYLFILHNLDYRTCTWKNDDIYSFKWQYRQIGLKNVIMDHNIDRHVMYMLCNLLMWKITNIRALFKLPTNLYKNFLHN